MENEYEVKIFDNFLSKEDLTLIHNYVKRVNSWDIQTSTRNSPNEFLYYDVSNEKYFNTYLCEKIKEKLENNYNLERIYFNGQWFARNGDFHVDGTSITVLIYISEYQFGWGGFTEFILSDNENLVVSPIQNRMICFSGSITHKAYSFAHQDCPMRISLSYKFIQ